MHNKKKWVRNCFWGLLGLILFLIVLKYDLAISFAINSLRSPWLDSIMLFLEKISMGIIVVVPLAIIFMNKKFRDIRNWTVSLLGAYAITLLIKIIVARARPFSLGLNTPAELIDSTYSKWDFSFPSNHASTAFSSFFFIPRGIWRMSWLLISVLMMFSRVYFGLHYLSDVIAGAAIGLGVSYLISKYADRMFEMKWLNKLKHRRL